MALSFSPTLDLLNCDADIIINTANCVGIMGKGVAKLISDAYPGVREDFRNQCGIGLNCAGARDERYAGKRDSSVPPCILRNEPCPVHKLHIGNILFFKTGSRHGPSHILHLPTKQHWYGNSKLEHVETSLTVLANRLRSSPRAYRISMPPPGCGNGGLNWSDVQTLIIRTLGHPDLNRHSITCRSV